MRLAIKLMHSHLKRSCLKPSYLNRVLFVVIFLAMSPSFSAEKISKERQTELANLLDQDCGSCHGSLLKGGLGPSLLPEALKGKSAEFIKMTILDGRPNTAMPPWRPLLSIADVDWLTATLLSGELLSTKPLELAKKKVKQ